MKDLKETFKIKDVDNLQNIVINSGKKINWNPVTIADNQAEFHYTKHLTNFYTIVSWTTEGIINLSSNYKKKSIMIDLGGYRNASNEKIKLSILREIELKSKRDNNNYVETEKTLRDFLESKNNDKISIDNNKNVESYSEQISQKDNSQNKAFFKIVLIAIVIIIGLFIYNDFFNQGKNKYVHSYESCGFGVGTFKLHKNGSATHYNYGSNTVKGTWTAEGNTVIIRGIPDYSDIYVLDGESDGIALKSKSTGRRYCSTFLR